MSAEEHEFYLAYATHLGECHRQLRSCLERIEQQWREYREEQREPGAGHERLVAELTELRAVLDHHFQEEEAGGCVEEAVLREPSLSPAARKLNLEDPQLIARLDDVIRRLRTVSRETQSVEEDYQRLVGRIREHAASESRIVEQSFGIEVD
jgi:hypothetical protein